MSQSKKYKSFGIRRANNMSDISDKKAALNNLLNDFTELNPDEGITFISEDLNAIRGLKDTDVEPESFIQLAGTTPITIRVDQNGDVLPDDDGNIVTVPINPLIRLEDRFKIFRSVTEEPSPFASGQGPRAYFIPSTLLPSNFQKQSKVEDQLETNLSDSSIQVSDDFWVLGEFVINDRLRTDFPDEYGGILWEGYYIPNPSSSIHTFFYETSGLFHIEYDRLGDGNWQVLKSIYAKQREVIVATDATDSFTITLEPGETTYLSVGDFLDIDEEVIITAISGDVITVEKEVTVTQGQTLTFDMNLGEQTTSGSYTINEVLDRAEIPQIKKRIFWWFPDTGDYEPSFKYLRNIIGGRSVYDYFFLNQEPAAVEPAAGSVRELLDSAITPSQDTMEQVVKTSRRTTSIYTPKPFISDITKASINISFADGNRSVQGSFSATEIGNIIVPTDTADLGVVVPKNMKIKDLLGSNTTSTFRILNQEWKESRESYPVSVIDHNGLVDYFVATSSGTTVTIQSLNDNTVNLRKDMYCVVDNTKQFIRITDVTSPTTFTTSANLDISGGYVYIYSDSGLLDKSLDVFCAGVLGQTLAATALSGTNTLEMVSVAGIDPNMIVQFGNAIPIFTNVSSISGTTVTLSNAISATINQDETIVFAPAGTSVNKEICVLPLDLSPPFIGVQTGLSTNGLNISSSESTFNLKVDGLTLNTTVSTAGIDDNYNSKISIVNSGLSILATKIV
jgi:hypothetical protein